MKDFYDLYLFDKVQRQNIDFKVLKDALRATAELCGSEALLPRYAEIITSLRGSGLLKQRWEKSTEWPTYTVRTSLMKLPAMLR